MASKQAFKLIDVQKKVISWSLKLADFFEYTIFMQKREILLIGDQSQPMYKKLSRDLQKKCRITLINQFGRSNESLDNKQIQCLSITKDSYKDIEQKLNGRKYNAIIVTPTMIQESKEMDFSDQQFVINFPNTHYKNMMRNVLAYRLAYKYLTKTGVIILSCDQKQLIKAKLSKKALDQPYQDELILSKEGKSSIINDIISAQVIYLGVVIGDRDYTNLHSCSVIAASNQISHKNLELVSQYYKNWANRKLLPHPGSFALFRPAGERTIQQYIEYL